MKISDFPFFSNLSRADSLSLSENTRTIEFTRGETIAARGAQIRNVYFIISGRVKETTVTQSGKEVVFNTLSQGDCFGIVSPLRTEVYKSDFVASIKARVYAVRVNEFVRLMRANNSVSDSVIAEVTRVAYRFSEKLYEIRALDVPARTRAELLRHMHPESAPERSNYIEISDLPTHEEIANTIFSHREAVTREISRLRKNGVIVKTNHNRLVANLSLLEKMAVE